MYPAVPVFVVVLTLLTHVFAAFAPINRPNQVARKARLQHGAVEIIGKRQVVPVLPPAVPAETTSGPSIITYVTPSPSAQPIPITSQGQSVTSYIPKITVCALPPLAFVSGKFSNPAPTRPPYGNYSVSLPTGSGTCLTTYSPTVTPICYTVLNGLASRTTVTDCTQEITFSSDVDFILETPVPTISGQSLITSGPYVRSLKTYYIATWNEFKTSGVAPENVGVKICTTYANGTTICVGQVEVWHVQTVTLVTSTTTHIDLTTTVKGPALVMVETFHLDITDTKTTFSLSTRMDLEYEFETLTTIRESGSSGRPTTTKTRTSTSTITRGVIYNTEPLAEASPSYVGRPTLQSFNDKDEYTTIRKTTTLSIGRLTSTMRNWNVTTSKDFK